MERVPNGPAGEEGTTGDMEVLVVHEVLPTEVMMHTMSFLTPKALLRAELVCTAWRDVANSERVWELVHLSAHGSRMFAPVQPGISGGGGGAHLLIVGHLLRHAGDKRNSTWRELCIKSARSLTKSLSDPLLSDAQRIYKAFKYGPIVGASLFSAPN